MLPTIATGNVGSALAGEFANSLRFDDGSNDYLNRTQSTSPTSADIGTISIWFKRSDLGTTHRLIHAYSDSTNFCQILIASDGKMTIKQKVSDVNVINLITNQVFRDPSAWYHIVVAVDTTQGTSSNRVKLYVNGSQVTSFSTETYDSQNNDFSLFNKANLQIGWDNTNSKFSGYMSEVVYVDGQQLTPTSFGEFDEDTGIWKPIDVSGLTFGTNGFYLDFENSGSLGNDKSGNGNNFTVNNLTSDDQVIDTPTNNFATLNPLDNYWSNGTLSNGNLTFLSDTSNVTYIPSTIGVNSGKWYWEVEFDAKSGGSDSPVIGITSTQPTAGNQQLGYFPNDWGYSGYSPSFYINNNTETSYGSSYTTNDIIGVAFDLDNNKLYFSKNGTWQNSGDPTSGATGTGALSITDPSSTPLGFYFPAICYYNVSNTGTFNANFGSSAFSYTVPSGYYALNTKNLAEFG